MEKENGVQLENIVYYRGETHYFVMTALRASLIEKGVILEDKEDRKALMAPSNINREKLHQVSLFLGSTHHLVTNEMNAPRPYFWSGWVRRESHLGI
jgi:hypothetical protein